MKTFIERSPEYIHQTYVCDGHSKQSLTVVVGRGKVLSFLQLLRDTSHFIGDLMGLADVTVGGHTCHHHLA